MANPADVLRDLLSEPAMRRACGIPVDAEIDETALDEFRRWCEATLGHREPTPNADLSLLFAATDN